MRRTPLAHFPHICLESTGKTYAEEELTEYFAARVAMQLQPSLELAIELGVNRCAMSTPKSYRLGLAKPLENGEQNSLYFEEISPIPKTVS